MDMTEFPFSNIHVREALYYATNPQPWPAVQTTGSARFPRRSTNRRSSATCCLLQLNSLYSQVETFPYSMAKAKQQLAMSPVPHGFTTTLNIPEDDLTDSLYGELLKSRSGRRSA